jgi:hypothetical protein
MTEQEAYQEHIRYTHDTYCRIVIRMRPLTLPVCWRRGGDGKSLLNI